ncbi:MAG: NAD-dependent epimerase/dehydratase family protein, partial [Saprospiraceae bacterium]|nr:NAD-dependent epimerase/dehydratase family protein [Saprospiraceae bacterium]
MKTLVTGATGYLGIPLVKALVCRGMPVRALIRTESKSHHIRHPLVELVKGDITDSKSLKRAVKGCDQIFHLAAFAGIWTRNPQLYYQVNVEGTRNLLSLAIEEGVRKVVLTSTAGVMGPVVNQGVPVNEQTVYKPTFFSLYDESKFEAENVALGFQDRGM